MIPAVQPSVICFGETLWDFLPGGKQPGGAPMNVAYHLGKLGVNVAVVSRVGNDELGKELLAVMTEKQIETANVQIDKTLATSTVVARLQDNHEMKYEIVENVAWDNIEYNNAISDLVTNADYFVFGTLAARSAATKATLFKLMEPAKTKVLDINLRAPHYNRELIETLLAKADIVKLNEAELKLISQWFLTCEDEEKTLDLLQKKFDINTIIVTKGAEGALLKVRETLYRHDGFQVKIADTVGSGDSFLAGVIFQLIDQVPNDEILDFANKLGAFITTKKGACPKYHLDNVTTSRFLRQKTPD